MLDNIFSIDVEEIFHTQLFNNNNHKNKFRTSKNIRKILNIFDEYEATATFFIVGEIALNYPNIIDDILEFGHEIGFHGWNHQPLWRINEKTFSDSLKKIKKMYKFIKGFRAPSFSLNNQTIWALRVLEDNNFSYDSSLMPCFTGMYGVNNAPIFPYIPSKDNLLRHSDSGIMEFPLLVDDFLGFRYPVSGGFYLRLSPRLVYNAIKKRQNYGVPSVLYLHNWELDEYTKSVKNSLLGKMISYYNISKTEKFLIFLLKNFKFTSFQNYLSDFSDEIEYYKQQQPKEE